MWLHKAITTVLGLGYAPIAPGTFGAMGGVILMGLVYHFNLPLPLPFFIALIIIITLVGVWSTNKVSPIWGDDPSKVVVDELAGYLITMLFVPLSWTTILIGFVLFRFFDILKPLGIRWIDKNLKDGWGVMFDDVLAGIYSCLILHLYIYLSANYF